MCRAESPLRTAWVRRKISSSQRSKALWRERMGGEGWGMGSEWVFEGCCDMLGGLGG
jgi:hypothetical protein